MRRLLWILGFVDLVWTEDEDKQYRLRIVRNTPFGKRFVYGRTYFWPGELSQDGSITGHHSMRRWKPYEPFWKSK